jgi:hypothetical protein
MVRELRETLADLAPFRFTISRLEASANVCEVWEHADAGWRMLHAVPL